MSPLTPRPPGDGRILPPVAAEKSKRKVVAGVLVVRAATAREEDDPPECPSPLSIDIRLLKKLQSIKGSELKACELVGSDSVWASLCRKVDQGDLGLE